MSRIFICGIVFQLSVFTLAFSMEGKGQSQSVYDIQLDFESSPEARPLDEALELLSQETGFNFSFIDQEINPASYDIVLNTSGVAMAEVLESISQQTDLSFKRVNDNIFIKRNKVGVKRIVEVIMAVVSGKVTDEFGESLPGTTVLEKGTSNGTVTDIDGKYSLEVSGEESVLSFSFVGYTSQEIRVGNRSTIDVILNADMTSLEEVVVVGYGTQKKEEVTSSLAQVDQKEFVQGNVVDAGQLLQGKVAGLTVANPSGDPTGGTQILLRGNSTLLGSNNSPLVLVNGVPGDLKLVAPEDIESISVLKDGSAAAIYGTRGTNGVILITTKQASDNYASSVDYSANFSTQQITRQLDAEDYRQEIADGLRPAGQDLGSSTDWMDEITRTPFSQIHNITFRGGNSKTNYLVSGNIRDLEGIFIKSDNRTYTGRIDVNHNMFDEKLRFNLGVLSRTVRFNNTGDGMSFNGYTYRQALIRNPTAPVTNEDGSWNEDTGNFNYENSVSRLRESDGQIRSQNTRLTSTIVYEPIKGLQFKSLMSYNQFNNTRGYAESRNHISTLRDGRNGFVSNGTRDVQERLIELTAQYSHNTPNHSVTVLGGYGYQDTYGRDFWMQNNDFQTDAFSYHNPGLGKGIQEGEANIGGSTWSTNLISFFGRGSYSFKDRYLLSGSLRYEAASQLYGTENPWGLFPAISAGWRLENEPFMSGADFVDQLKIRAGYGVTGNPNNEGFRAVTLLTYGSPMYYNGQWINTIYTAQNPNPDLKWEEKHETNIGVDFGLFDNFITGSVDLYKREIKDLLFDYAVPTPPNLAPTTRANVGVMENKGIEVLLNITPISTSDFSWTTTFLFSTNSNKLVSLSNDLY
ncbi:SusC/RagA family TonB-linked outer membrane protein [Reichenbachiella ulvae]|uniref:SusC/RagA family TonB-linked outer membrane protein n=1 Tax=Reichenbachiella ulvae TaxID=2980104 RepID=A0ABT3CU88_9BACT|nr:SusC/RagA family TonB-linked outer membrane protein [Reichenbachiella ulvae]MCV9387261.1 SusC/RagA family TonB-linked outer membrane protein [Reichenbachiella ulvae]